MPKEIYIDKNYSIIQNGKQINVYGIEYVKHFRQYEGFDEQIVLVCYIDKTYPIARNGKETMVDGIEYIKHLRRFENFKEPVLFTSFLSEKYILTKRSQTNIINAIGHAFIQLPYTKEDLEKVNKYLQGDLNDMQLSDIKLNYCLPRSALSAGFHDLKNDYDNIKRSETDKFKRVEKLKELFQNYKKGLEKDYPDCENLVNGFEKECSFYQNQEWDGEIPNYGSFNSPILEKYLITEYKYNGENKTEKAYSSKPWKILFLEDQESVLGDLKDELEKRKISYKIIDSASVAKEEIAENDKNNQYTVIVSDFRLYEESQKDKFSPHQQSIQGYDFLEWVSKQNRFNAMVALSGLDTRFLMESFRKRSLNIKVYSKNNLRDGGLQFFVDELEQLGDEYFEVICSQPQAVYWNESLKKYYVYHRNHNDYLANEDKINKKAELICREFEFMLSSNISSELKLETLSSLSVQAQQSLGDEIEKYYDNFLDKLLIRRIVFFLLLKGVEKNPALSLIHYHEVVDDLFNDSPSSTINKSATEKKRTKTGNSDEVVYYTLKEVAESNCKQVAYKNGISTDSDIPYNLLVEEKNFLNNYMSLPLFNMAEMMDQTYVLINNILSKYFKDDLVKILGEKYCKSDGVNNTYKLCSVSIKEIHILTEKAIKFLISKKDNERAKKLISLLQDLCFQLSNLLPANYYNIDKLLQEFREYTDVEKIKVNNNSNNETIESIWREIYEQRCKRYQNKITDNFQDKLNKLSEKIFTEEEKRK